MQITVEDKEARNIATGLKRFRTVSERRGADETKGF